MTSTHVLSAMLMMASLSAVCRADNPVVQTKFTVDPAPLVVGDTLYLFTGHDEDDARGFHMLARSK
jgi:arabinoxylan arabinofuranohydrolase